MALEMVSPPKKSSQPAFLPSFSLDGERLQMKVEAALANTPGYQHFGGDTYVASRDPLAWEAAPTAPLDPTLVAGGPRFGNPAIFTSDLGSWAQFGATRSQAQVGVARLFGGGLDGSFGPLSPLLTPIDDSGSNETQIAVAFLEVDGASADLSTSVFRGQFPSTSYLPGDPRSNSPEPEPGGDRNTYVALSDEGGEPAIELLARDKDDKVWGGRCGAHLGGQGATFNQGAVSSTGERIVFSTRPAQPWDPEAGEEPPCDTDNGLRVLERVKTPEGPVITELAPGGGGAEAAGDDLFQGASADGTKVYFTSPRKLTASDVDASSEPCGAVLSASKGCDLYLYDSTRPEGDRILHASQGEDPGQADVLSSVTAIAGDGSRVYFVAQGVLTANPNPQGAIALAGQPNLYCWEPATETTKFVGLLAPGDQGALWGMQGTLFGDAYSVPFRGTSASEGGDGRNLIFATEAQFEEDDDGDGDLDAGDDYSDVVFYDAVAETLQMISADPDEEEEPHDVMVNPAIAKVAEYNFGEATRWVSESGQVVAFATAQPLVPGDTDEAVNPYVWSEGELGRVPATITEPPAAAPVGGQIAFSTPTALLSSDVDTAADVYVARADGGFPEPAPPPPPCDPLSTGSCQGPIPPAPQAVSPGTVAASSGNLKPPARCKKGFVKRKGKCVKKKRGKPKATRRAGAGQGGNR